MNQALSSGNDGSIAPKIDGRGKDVNPRKIDRKIIKIHTESFHPCISHYKREHEPNRRYLPSDITKNNMDKDFIQKSLNFICSYDLYCKFLKEMGISFTK